MGILTCGNSHLVEVFNHDRCHEVTAGQAEEQGGRRAAHRSHYDRHDDSDLRHINDAHEGASAGDGILVSFPVHNTGACVDEPPIPMTITAAVEGVTLARHSHIGQIGQNVGLLTCVPQLAQQCRAASVRNAFVSQVLGPKSAPFLGLRLKLSTFAPRHTSASIWGCEPSLCRNSHRSFMVAAARSKAQKQAQCFL